MHLCADFHAGLGKEYLVFFLLFTELSFLLGDIIQVKLKYNFLQGLLLIAMGRVLFAVQSVWLVLQIYLGSLPLKGSLSLMESMGAHSVKKKAKLYQLAKDIQEHIPSPQGHQRAHEQKNVCFNKGS